MGIKQKFKELKISNKLIVAGLALLTIPGSSIILGAILLKKGFKRLRRK